MVLEVAGSAGARMLARVADDADCNNSGGLVRMGSIGRVRSFSAQLLDKVVTAVVRGAVDDIDPACLEGREQLGFGGYAVVEKAW